MFDVRFHGRGGQGVVTAAELLSVAAFGSGLHAQAIPTFGSERTGAPVAAFCRISETPIRTHEPVDAPDAVVVQDPTLLHVVPVLEGASPTTYVLVNSSRDLAGLGIEPGVRRVTVAATELARSVLRRPLPNTALLGALAALTDVVDIDAVAAAIRQRFAPAVAEDNVLVATRAYDDMRARITTGEVASDA